MGGGVNPESKLFEALFSATFEALFCLNLNIMKTISATFVRCSNMSRYFYGMAFLSDLFPMMALRRCHAKVNKKDYIARTCFAHSKSLAKDIKIASLVQKL